MLAITTWIKTENMPNLTIQAFKEGDLVNYWSTGNHTVRVGEVVRILNNQLIVHFLEQKPQYGNKLWQFNEEEEHMISPLNVIRHFGREEEKLTKDTVRKLWDAAGYVVGLNDFCLKQDENLVPLDIAPGDSDSEEDTESIADEMKDFIVPDSEGEAFCHPNMENLTEEQRQWVGETHKAVADWNNWNPQDDQQKAIKSFVDSMSGKYSHKEDERRFATGQPGLD